VSYDERREADHSEGLYSRRYFLVSMFSGLLGADERGGRRDPDATAAGLADRLAVRLLLAPYGSRSERYRSTPLVGCLGLLTRWQERTVAALGLAAEMPAQLSAIGAAKDNPLAPYACRLLADAAARPQVDTLRGSWQRVCMALSARGVRLPDELAGAIRDAIPVAARGGAQPDALQHALDGAVGSFKQRVEDANTPPPEQSLLQQRLDAAMQQCMRDAVSDVLLDAGAAWSEELDPAPAGPQDPTVRLSRRSRKALKSESVGAAVTALLRQYGVEARLRAALVGAGLAIARADAVLPDVVTRVALDLPIAVVEETAGLTAAAVVWRVLNAYSTGRRAWAAVRALSPQAAPAALLAAVLAEWPGTPGLLTSDRQRTQGASQPLAGAAAAFYKGLHGRPRAVFVDRSRALVSALLRAADGRDLKEF